MTRIVAFAIDNLAGRGRRITAELNSGRNVFWGVNGSGKTSLLKILHAALQNDTKSIKRVPFDRAEVHIYSDQDDIVYTRTLIKDQINERQVTIIPSDPESLDDEMGVEVSLIDTPPGSWTIRPSSYSGGFLHAYLPVSRITDFHLADRRRREIARRHGYSVEEPYSEIHADETSMRWSQYRLNLANEIRRIQDQGLADIFTSVFSQHIGTLTRRGMYEEVEPAAAYDLVRQYLRSRDIKSTISKKDFSRTYATQESSRTVVTEIDNILRKIERANEPERILKDLISQFFTAGKTLATSDRSILIKIADRTVSLMDLSSGEQQLLRIFVECLAAELNTIIIDEPELSLHVDWQTRLGESMTILNPHAQLILATHSPEIIASVRDNEIFEI